MQKLNYRKLLNVMPWIVTMIAVVLLAFRSDTSAQRPTIVNAGRYQLFNATFYGTADGKQTSEGTNVFKIDTETGATWIYFTQSDGKNSIEGWAPINNLVRRQ